jgi:large subunit ribosomal protein L24
LLYFKNQVDMEFPSYLLKGEKDKRPYRPFPLPYLLDDVRLVVPLDDPDTGATRDVVVKHVYGGEPIVEQQYGSTTPRHTRYISGLDIEIPWPESDAPEYNDEAIDTLRFQVDEKTYLPSLLTFPFPSTMLDELRNKYSKFRTRHDPEWVAKKEEQDAYEEWQRSRKLLTPKTEFLAKRVEKIVEDRELNKDESGNLKMSLDTRKFVENFMANQRQAKLTGASPSPSPAA